MILKIQSFVKSINLEEIEIDEENEINKDMQTVLNEKFTSSDINLFVMINKKKIDLSKSFKENNIENNQVLSLLVQYVPPKAVKNSKLKKKTKKKVDKV